jgi:6-phosphogluconolactonase
MILIINIKANQGETMQKLQVFETEEQLFSRAASLFIALAEKAATNYRKLYVAFSGGGTPNKLYPYLISQKDIIDWNDMEVYFSDERLVPLTDEESNYFQASKNFLDLIDHPVSQRYAPDVSLSSDEAAWQYEMQIVDNVPMKNGLPYFDIVFLGLGNDGHTASLFPNKIGEEIFEHLVIPAEANYEGRPSARISMTPRLINNAANVIFLLSGASKAEAVAHSIMTGEDWQTWPARSIIGKKNEVYWFMDEAAAKKLEV